jgi:ribosomal protein L29
MKISEIRKKSKDDLLDLLVKKREDLRSLRFRNSAGKVKNVKTISANKRIIAKILTVLKEFNA